MMNDKVENKQEQYNKLTVFSLCIAGFLVVMLLNFFLKIVPLEKLQGLPVIIPLFIAPMGFIPALISLKKGKNNIALLGVILNLALWLFPAGYFIIGTIAAGT